MKIQLVWFIIIVINYLIKCAYNMSNKLVYQPELVLCQFIYSKQYCTQIQIFTEDICKARALVIKFRL